MIMIKKQELINRMQFVDDAEKQELSRALDQALLAEKRGYPTYTEFLDLRKISLMTSLLVNETVSVKMEGGYPDAERALLCFYTGEFYYNDFPISILEITPAFNQFTTKKLSHRDYLGSILGLGIKRNRIGDLLLYEDRVLLFAHEEIASYIELHLNQVGRIPVQIRSIEASELQVPESEYKEISTTVSSLRMDSILSKAFGISRSTASQYIKGGKAFLNWQNITSCSKIIKEGDRLTLRGYGKMKLKEVGHVTKKDRQHVILHRYI